jgi:hypothetical protein
MKLEFCPLQWQEKEIIHHSEEKQNLHYHHHHKNKQNDKTSSNDKTASKISRIYKVAKEISDLLFGVDRDMFQNESEAKVRRVVKPPQIYLF